MAWKDVYSYAEKWLGARNGHQLAAHKEDLNLPLAARIGSLIQLQQTPLIRALTQGSLIALPGQDESLIRAISRIQINLSGSLYRYYLNVGDDQDAEKFLQMYVDSAGSVTEVLYCSRLLRLIPQSSEDQEAYLGQAGYGLGDLSYTLWRAQVQELGMAEASLAAIFGELDSVIYQRDIGDPQLHFVAPLQGTETRIDDAAGVHGLQQEIVFMPYSRALGSGADAQREILLISTEIVQSVDGDSSRRGIYVDFMVGIPVELDRLVVQ